MPFELIRPGTHIDFVARWRLCVGISLTLVVLSLALAPFRFRLGLDFSTGTEVLVNFDKSVPVDEERVRNAVTALGIEGAEVIRYGDLGTGEYSIRFQEFPASLGGDRNEQVAALADGLRKSIGPLEVARAEVVGPRVGAELRRDGLSALGIAMLLILIYIAFRFSTRFAPGAVIALIHDVIITSGVLVLFGVEFDLRVLAALLAIIGYSLNDTIIVYDRIRETMGVRTKSDLPEVINLSINQTLSRTLITSGTTLLAVLALLLVGGEVIRPFALAMAIGIVVGTYSSIYIAAPVLLVLEQRTGARAGKA